MTIARPYYSPRIATAPTFTGGAENGAPTRVRPSSGRLLEGYRYGPLPFQEYNSVVGNQGDHVELLRDMNVANWRLFMANLSGTAFDNTLLSPGGYIQSSWSEPTAAWFVPGSATNGRLFVGDGQGWGFAASGAASTYTNCFASGNKLLAWSAETVVAGATVIDTFDTVAGTWSLGGSFGAHSADNGVRHACRLSTGRVVAVGRGTVGICVAWRSDDDGATWASSQMNVTNLSDSVGSKVAVGPNDRLLAITPGAGVVAFLVSNDGGVTWTERIVTAPAQNMIDVAWLPGANMWIVTTTAAILAVGPNPATDAITTLVPAGGHTAMGTWYDQVVFAISAAGQVRVGSSSDAFASPTGQCFREFTGTGTIRGVQSNEHGQFCAVSSGAIRLSSRYL